MVFDVVAETCEKVHVSIERTASLGFHLVLTSSGKIDCELQSFSEQSIVLDMSLLHLPSRVKELLLVDAVVSDNAFGDSQRWKRSLLGHANHQKVPDNDMPPPLTPWKKASIAVPRRRKGHPKLRSPPLNRWEASPEVKGKDKLSLSMMIPTPLRYHNSLISVSSSRNHPAYSTVNSSPLKKPVRRGSFDEEQEEGIRNSIERLMIDLDKKISDFTLEEAVPCPAKTLKEVSSAPMRKPKRQNSNSFDTVSILNEALLLMDDLTAAISTASVISAS